MYNYYFAVASQNFLLNEEPLEEILRERTKYYKSQNKNIDFWFVLEPHFLYSADFDNKLLNLPDVSYAAVISLDQNFIKWLKLRIGFIAIGDFKSESIFITNY